MRVRTDKGWLGRSLTASVAVALLVSGPTLAAGAVTASTAQPAPAPSAAAASTSADPAASADATTPEAPETEATDTPAADATTPEESPTGADAPATPSADESASEEATPSEETPAEDPPSAEETDRAPPSEEPSASAAPDENTPVQTDVAGIRVVPGDASAVVQWPDFGPGENYVVQLEQPDGSWKSTSAKIAPAVDAVPGEGTATVPSKTLDHQVTLTGLDTGETYVGRIVAAPSEEQALAATEPAVEATTAEAAEAQAAAPAAEGDEGAVSSQPIIITPLATSTSTDIVVNVRATAQPLGVNGSIGTNYANTVGAQFRLYTYTTAAAGPQAPVTDSWATCTVAANGSCLMNVPATNSGAANYNRQFWVVQEAAAPGVYANPILYTGSSGGPSDLWRVPGLTQPMAPNTVQTLPRTTTTESSGNAASFGATANSRVNPQLIPQCTAGIRLALVMDLSSSVSASQRQAFREAIVGTGGLFDILQPTNSSIAVFTFGTNTPATGSNNYPAPLLLNAANRNELNDRIDITTSGTQYTNWDRAMREVANQNPANDYDAVLFITDGAPNYIAASDGTGAVQVNGTNVTIRSLEAAIYSANAIKAQGVRMVGVGVGAGVAGTVGANLRAISGQTAGEDYFQTANWDLLEVYLRNIASAATCQVPIRVTKQLLSPTGTLVGPDNGWNITTVPSAITPGTATLNPTAQSQLTGSGSNPTGQANWSLVFTQPSGTATVTISEDASSKPGYAFVSGTCTVDHLTGADTTVPMTSPSVTLPGITVTDHIECVIRNQPSTATVVIRKQTNVGTPLLFPFIKSANVPAGTIAGGGAATANGFTLGSNATYTVTVPVLADGGTPYTFTEDLANLPGGWRLEGTPTCTAESETPGASADLSTTNGTVTINSIDARVTVECTYQNTNLPLPATNWTTWKWSSPTSGSADEPAQVLPGSTITYQLYASNKEGGNQPVTDLVLTDDLAALLPYVTLPAGFPASGIEIQDRSDDDASGPIEPPPGDQIPPAQRGTVSYTGGVLTWSIPNLDPDRRLRLSFTVTVNADAYGATLSNSLTADSTDPDIPPPTACTGEEPCETFHETPLPEWTTAKTSQPASGRVGLGESIVYRVTATNTGLIPIPNAVLTDDLSGVLGAGKATLGAIQWSVPTGTGTVLGPTPTYSAGTGLLTGTITSLAPGSSVAMVYTVTVDPHAYSQVLRNAAWGDSPAGPPEACVEADPCSTTHGTPLQPRLRLVKQVDPQHGGQAAATEWTLSAAFPGPPAAPGLSGPGDVSGPVWSSVRYNLNEVPSANVSTGWTVGTTWSCVDAPIPGEQGGFDLQPDVDAPPTQSRITLNPGANVTCTIVNTDIPALLTLVKVVDAANSGTSVTRRDWNLTATPVAIPGQDPVSGRGDPDDPEGVSEVEVLPGEYLLTESGPAGFDEGDWSCENGALDGSRVTVALGASVTCTITNTAIAPRLTLIKSVDNTAGGTATPAAWTLTATPFQNPDQPPVSGPGDPVTGIAVDNVAVQVGTYLLSESDGPPGYEPDPDETWECTGTMETWSAAGSVTLPEGGSATCTITNVAQQARLTLEKSVTGPDGVTLPEDTAWTLTATGPTPDVSGPEGDTAVTNAPVLPGDYVLSESGGPDGFLQDGVWSCDNGDSGTTVSVALGDAVTCTVVNTLASTTLSLEKRWEEAAAGDSAELSIGGINGHTAVSNAPDAPSDANTASVTVFAGETVNLAETLSVDPNHYYTTTLVCDRPGLEWVTGATEGTFTVPETTPLQPVRCTFTNRRELYQVTLTKIWEDGVAGDTTTLRIAGGVTDPAEAVSTSNGQPALWTDEANPAQTGAYEGETITLSEVLGADNVGQYESTLDLACAEGEGDPVALPGPTFTMPGVDVSCTLTNHRLAEEPVEPTVTAASCSLTDPLVVEPGTITITEARDYDFFVNGQPYEPGTYDFPPGTYTVTAELVRGVSLASLGFVQQLAQATYTWTVTVEEAPVCPILVKVADPPSGTEVVRGDVIDYLIVVANAGGDSVSGETIVDTLPAGAELVAGSVEPAGIYDAAARTITWTVDLPPASGGTPSEVLLTYSVEVTAEDGILVNTATWVERELTVTTEHPVGPPEPSDPDEPDTDLPDTGAGNASDMAVAGLLLLGGGTLLTLGVRRRRREE